MDRCFNDVAQLLLKGTDRHLDAGTVSSVVITGLVVVFIGLILLILFVTLYGLIFKNINDKKAAKIKAEAEAAAENTRKEAENSARSAPAAPMEIEDGISDEIVAVIAAAVAAMSAQSGKKLVLRSVKNAKPSRSVWASAGIAENTRQF